MIGYNLKRLREERGISQQALGSAAQLPSSAHVSHIESGRIGDPSSTTLKKLSDALGVPMASLFAAVPDTGSADGGAA